MTVVKKGMAEIAQISPGSVEVLAGMRCRAALQGFLSDCSRVRRQKGAQSPFAAVFCVCLRAGQVQGKLLVELRCWDGYCRK